MPMRIVSNLTPTNPIDHSFTHAAACAIQAKPMVQGLHTARQSPSPSRLNRLRANIHALKLCPQHLEGLVEQHALDAHFLSTFSRNSFQTVVQNQLRRTALPPNQKRVLGNAAGLLAVVAQLHILSRGKLGPALGLGIISACTASHTLRSAARLMNYGLLSRALWQATQGNRHAQFSLIAAAAGAFLGRAMGNCINRTLPEFKSTQTDANSQALAPTKAPIKPPTWPPTQPASPNTCRKPSRLVQALQHGAAVFKRVDKPVGQWLENHLNKHPKTPLIEPLLTLRIAPEASPPPA